MSKNSSTRSTQGGPDSSGGATVLARPKRKGVGDRVSPALFWEQYDVFCQHLDKLAELRKASKGKEKDTWMGGSSTDSSTSEFSETVFSAILAASRESTPSSSSTESGKGVYALPPLSELSDSKSEVVEFETTPMIEVLPGPTCLDPYLHTDVYDDFECFAQEYDCQCTHELVTNLPQGWFEGPRSDHAVYELPVGWDRPVGADRFVRAVNAVGYWVQSAISLDADRDIADQAGHGVLVVRTQADLARHSAQSYAELINYLERTTGVPKDVVAQCVMDVQIAGHQTGGYAVLVSAAIRRALSKRPQCARNPPLEEQATWQLAMTVALARPTGPLHRLLYTALAGEAARAFVDSHTLVDPVVMERDGWGTFRSLARHFGVAPGPTFTHNNLVVLGATHGR